MPSIAGLLLAAAGFAVWAVFSGLPLMTGGRGIREAWDTELYWIIGVPLANRRTLCGDALGLAGGN